MDQETEKINRTKKDLYDLVNHSGWKIARNILTEKILALQNVAEYTDQINAGNATKLMKEMKANQRSAEILFDWLRQIEGEAGSLADESQEVLKSHIVRL